MRSSQRAFDKIIAYEVSSRAFYIKKFQRPEWPGVQSGATVGIGYDLGQTPAATIRADWSGRVSGDMLAAMVSASGKTGEAGRAATAAIYNKVLIPWDVAIAVHKERVVPRWEARVMKALPNADKLPGDCFGALLSLSFNRGTSFSTTGARYSEMRAIRAAMIAENYDAIPGYLRAMKRIWPNSKGLRARRDDEAKLFATGLKGWDRGAAAIEVASDDGGGRPARPDPINMADDDDQQVVTPTIEAGTVEAPAAVILNKELSAKENRPVIVSTIAADERVREVQTQLRAKGYYIVGEPDGKLGEDTKDAIMAFRRRNDLPVSTDIDADLMAALATADKKPISESRALTTVSDLAKKNEGVRAAVMNRLTGLWSAIVSGVVAVSTAVAGAFKDIWESDAFVTIRDIAGAVPVWVWFALGGALAFGVYWNGRRGAEADAQAHRDGKSL